eukprot:TRINITY_DN21306_c0_g2_i1.p1 TRINITY_DN21306_c0_g2~~TRINITY_DN21306_c0_g2_i1.p1  ORF type:complete len:383 (+),score=119.44 TRINITY_DN21306_c0_g2_i1:83-1231(+)
MGKRAAAAAPAVAAWKRQRGTGPRSKVNTIIAALRDTSLASEATAAAREMLAAGAVSALSSVIENRHGMQETISGHIKEVLEDISERLSKQVEEAKEARATTEADLELQKAQLQQSQDELQEAKATIEAKETVLQAAKTTLKETEQATAASASQMRTLTKEKDSLEKEQEKYKDLNDNSFKVLLEKGPDAGANEKETKTICDKLMREITKLSAEPALLASAPAVLLKRAEDRKGFDVHVLGSMQSILAARLDDIAGKLEANATSIAALEPEASSRKEAGEKAQAEKDAAQAELDAAQRAADEKKASLNKAQNTVEGTTAALDERSSAITTALQEVEAFGDVLACHNFLASRSSVVPEELPAEPEEVKAETAKGEPAETAVAA